MNRTADGDFGGASAAKLTHLKVFLLLTVLVAVVYGRVPGHEFLINWDDNLYVTDNPAVRGVTPANLKSAFSTFFVGNYAPLQIVSYMLDYTLWGLRPAGYLVTNLALHAVNGFLLYLLVRRTTGLHLAAVGAALLFLLHPVQVETVAWISQRKNLLSMAFYLLGGLAYVSYRQESGGRKGLYWLSVAAFAAALLTKSAAVIFPVMILLYDVCFEKRPLVRSLPDKVPFIAIAAAAAFLTLLTQSVEYGGGGRTTYHGGSVYATLLTMLPVLASYLGMIFWPARLSAAYAPAIKSAPDMEVAAAAILLALVAWCAVHLFRRERSVFFWLALFPLGLLPVSQLVPLITLMNDRYLYYPMVGMAPFLAIGVTRLARNGSRPVRRLVILVSVAVLAMLAIAARQRTGVWQNAVTLWGDAVAKVPHSPTARYSLAEAYFKAGRYEDAKPQLFEVTRMFPAMVAPHELLGNVFYASGDLDRAAESYRSALALKPDLPMANLCLGNIHLSRKEFDSARMRLLAAEKVNPDAPDVAYSLACVEALLGRNGDALAYLEKAFVKGFKGCQAVELNHELDSLRGLPEYIGIMTRFCGERSNR